MDEIVTFKGLKNGLLLVLDPNVSFDAILDEISQKVASAANFFKGASISIQYRGRKLTEMEEVQLKGLLEEKSGATIVKFSEEEQELQVPHRDKMEVRKHYFKGIHEGMTKFYWGTVRSGQEINYDGNLIVFGDVNPGAVLVASGNVVVMGALRGVVHAGSDGNREAVVIAFILQPTQLRIGDIITRPPDDDSESKQDRTIMPEVAYIKDDSIYIDRYLP